MPKQSFTGLEYVDSTNGTTDPADPGFWGALIADSFRGPIPCSGPTSMGQIAAAATVAGKPPTPASPLTFYWATNRKYYVDIGEGFIQHSAPVWATRVNVTFDGVAQTASATVTFPAGMFTSPPLVQVSSGFSIGLATYGAVTATSCTVTMRIGGNGFDPVGTSSVREISVTVTGV